MEHEQTTKTWYEVEYKSAQSGWIRRGEAGEKHLTYDSMREELYQARSLGTYENYRSVKVTETREVVGEGITR